MYIQMSEVCSATTNLSHRWQDEFLSREAMMLYSVAPAVSPSEIFEEKNIQSGKTLLANEWT